MFLILNIKNIISVYISEIIILFFIIEIICGFNCERGIKKYIKNVINFSLNPPGEFNDNSTIFINHNHNLFQLIISFLKKNFELFSIYLKEDNETINIFISHNNNDYNEINITSLKIIIFINKFIIITLLLNILFLDDEAMHNIRENNGNYNIVYRLPIIIFSELASWIICSLFFELPITFVNLDEFKNNIHELKANKDNNNKMNNDDVGEFSIIIEKFKTKFKRIRIIIYIFSFIFINEFNYFNNKKFLIFYI